MAIQDLINEVNSIQTKKQAIKEAITAKGVTSEGKLSKFADEIKQITTREPDWYIVNTFRYENGNEALLVRTSDKNAINANKYQMVEMGGGVTKDNDISNTFNSSYNDDIGITNGTYFPRETAYRSFTTNNSYSVVFDGYKDNLKLKFSDDKEILFNDVNVYNWLRGYKNQPLVDFNTLYLKSDGFSGDTVSSLSDFLTPTNISRTLTLDSNTTTPVLLIDSSIIVQAMNFKEMSRTGFISYFDKTVDLISLKPVSYANTYLYYKFYDNKEQWYGNLSPGNYIHLYKPNYSLVIFVSVNFVIDSNGQKHKNIEVYMYSMEINNYKVQNMPFELYLNFSQQGQQAIANTSSPKVFRRQVLAANGTPEPRASNFLTGSDALLEVKAFKITDYSKIRGIFDTTNLFVRKYSRFLDIAIYNQHIRISGNCISDALSYDISSNKTIKGFIRLNDDSNTMFPIELEEATRSIMSDTNFSRDRDYGRAAAIFPNGTANNNKMIIFISNTIDSDFKAFYIKKGNDYITNDSLSTTPKNTQLYLTTDTDTQTYLTTKSLSDIWTEINSLNKDDFEAYSEQ